MLLEGSPPPGRQELEGPHRRASLPSPCLLMADAGVSAGGGTVGPKALDKVAFLQSKGVVGYNKKKN